MNRPEAIIFDLGGVIIDFARVFNAWAQMSGAPAASLQTQFDADQSYQRHERGEISATEFFAVQRQRFALTLTDEQFLNGWNAIFGPEIDGVAALIKRARTLAPCYVFSNTNAAHQAFWEPALADTLALFDGVFVSNTLGLRKPEPDAFRAVCERIGASPDTVLFFDDTQENLDGAAALGITAIRVQSPADIEAALVACGA